VCSTVTVDQPALFIHGGYGATRRVTINLCLDCRWAHVVNVIEVNPRVSA
jgi:hypothetical protein